MLIIADTAENDPASSRPKADQLPPQSCQELLIHNNADEEPAK